MLGSDCASISYFWSLNLCFPLLFPFLFSLVSSSFAHQFYLLDTSFELFQWALWKGVSTMLRHWVHLFLLSFYSISPPPSPILDCSLCSFPPLLHLLSLSPGIAQSIPDSIRLILILLSSCFQGYFDYSFFSSFSLFLMFCSHFPCIESDFNPVKIYCWCARVLFLSFKVTICYC